MNARYLLTRAAAIVAVAAAIIALAWINEVDRRAERAATSSYCEGVATWLAESARGIHPLHRTGHPDYHGIAADRCPGLRPADPAPQHQLAPAGPSAFPVHQRQQLVRF